MNYVFFGSSEYALGVLQALCGRGMFPRLIVSQPDRPRGRGMRMQPTLVSAFARARAIALARPAVLKDNALQSSLKAQNADFFVVADYGKILPQAVIDIPNRACLAVHPSLLPRYRGPAPIVWALLNGDTQTGVTVFCVNARIDEGDIIHQMPHAIHDEDTVISLRAALAELGARVLVESVAKIHAHQPPVSQEQTGATYDRKLSKEDGRIHWDWHNYRIRNLIRATMQWPSAYTYYQGSMIKIIAADTVSRVARGAPGFIEEIEPGGIYISCGQEVLRVKTVIPQGKKEMSAYAFACGCHMRVGDRLESR